ncbi:MULTISPECIES: neutral/alkaline non-lysosomal ceramidase N-terminal domain-containing protein [unclassified Streptomyces]|uniref:neutral/alkaline non-lysosomal ceramidase N-terminal domain-containing protein n=1 Tax=unclassified Streptomyces TaxID=2593676 RepID=UPI0035DFD03E
MAAVAGSLAVGTGRAVAADAPAPYPYLVGRGIADITGAAAESGMMGYSKPDQQTGGIHQRLRARANAGDMSPNLGLAPGSGPTGDEFENTRIIGLRQSTAARRIHASATTPVRGGVDSRLR